MKGFSQKPCLYNMERFSVILFLSILIAVVKTSSTASKYISMQAKKKIKRTKSSVQYYSYCIATYKIILSGDIEINPGPDLFKSKCQICDRAVRCY